MLKTLRGRLAVSHLLPPLLIIPIMGMALVYFIETRLILPGLLKQLTDDAVVIARLARSEPRIFSDPQLAQLSLVDDIELDTATRVMILDAQGRLLASSDTLDASRLNQILDLPELETARQGDITRRVDYSPGLQGEVVDVFVPVTGKDGQMMGIVRLSYRFTTVAEQLSNLRYLIAVILAGGVISSAILGFILALTISRPIQRVTQAVSDLARGARTDELPEKGPAEVKTLQQAANYLARRTREMEDSRRQLLANLVHELGRPLGGLRMSIQVLRRGAKDDRQVLDELLAGMESETSLLERLLDDLSHLHDQVLGALELDFQEVALSEWLPVVLHSARDAAYQKGLDWKADIPNDLPTKKIDPQRLNQALGNLTANAIKYTPRGGEVSLSAGVEDQAVFIRVADDGPGIPESEQAKIFDPFFRGSQGRRIKQGMGLGLSIARDIVLAHQGRIEVESTPGLGSRFTIWLP